MLWFARETPFALEIVVPGSAWLSNYLNSRNCQSDFIPIPRIGIVSRRNRVYAKKKRRMDQRTIKLLIVAFTVVGVIVVVVSFNIHATLENSLTTNPGNCFFNPDTNRQLSSSYHVIKRNYEDSTESDTAEEDRIKMLCWTLNTNCYCFPTPTNKVKNQSY